jgi:segregation and condensation protein A
LSFAIKLPLFQGPFDLLLFFIERDELDIYDIPISKINQEFLIYLHQLEQLNMELASEFILVAATLMRIKAKMLIPRPVLDAEGNEIDPRQELVQHLLEYKKYKSVLADLSKLEEERQKMESRGNVEQEIFKLSQISGIETDLQNIDLYKLLKVYHKAIARFEAQSNKPIHTIIQYPYTISGQKEFLLLQLTEKERLSFEDLLQYNVEKIAVIYNFLAILELLQLQKISIHLGMGFNNFWIVKKEEAL